MQFFLSLSRACTSFSNSTPISSKHTHTKTSTTGEQGLNFTKLCTCTHAINRFAQCYITTIKWSVHVWECDSHMQFYQQSNSREKARGCAISAQRVWPAAQAGLSQVCCAVWSLNRDSQQQIPHLHLMQTSSRLQPRRTRGWVWTQQNFADRIEHPGGKKTLTKYFHFGVWTVFVLKTKFGCDSGWVRLK